MISQIIAWFTAAFLMYILLVIAVIAIITMFIFHINKKL